MTHDSFALVHADADLVVLAKNAPIAAVPSRDGEPSIQDLLRSEFGTLYAVHRIDQRVSGLLLFARTREAAARVGRLFASQSVLRSYWAICESPPPREAGDLVHRLVHDTRAHKARIGSRGEPVRLSYRIVGSGTRYTFVRVDTTQGRFHQVRAQLAASGAVIRGDLKYGARRSTPSGLIGLHSRSIAFAGPAGELRTYEAEPPDDVLWALFRQAMQES